jgi:hypothetical protein
MLLVIAAEEKKDLRLEGIPFPFLIKLGQKWVLFKNLQQGSRLKMALQQSSQRRLAYSNHTFNCNIFIDHNFT